MKGNNKIINLTPFFTVSYYNGSKKNSNTPIHNILDSKSSYHCSKRGKNFDLLLEFSGNEFNLHGISIQSPFHSPSPIKNGIIFVRNSYPQFRKYSCIYDDVSSEIEFKKIFKENFFANFPINNDFEENMLNFSNLKNKTFFFETDKVLYQCWKFFPFAISGRYIHIKLISSHSGMNIDILRIGILGSFTNNNTKLYFIEEIAECDVQRALEWNKLIRPLPKKCEKKMFYDVEKYKFAEMYFLSKYRKLPNVYLIIPDGKHDETRGYTEIVKRSLKKRKISAFQTVQIENEYDIESIDERDDHDFELIEKLNFFLIKGKSNFCGQRIICHFFGQQSNKVQKEVKLVIYGVNGEKFIMKNSFKYENVNEFFNLFLSKNLCEDTKSEIVLEDGVEPSNVKILIGSNFDKIVLDDEKDVLLVTTSSWCVPCKKIIKIFDFLSFVFEKNCLSDKIVFASIDVEKNDLKKKFFKENLKLVPLIKLFPSSRKEKGVVFKGEMSGSKILRFLHKNVTFSFDFSKLFNDFSKFFNKDDELGDLEDEEDEEIHEISDDMLKIKSDNVVEISSIDEFIKEKNKCKFLIVFLSADWCSPCVKVCNFVSELSLKPAYNKKNVKFIKINVDKCKMIVKTLKVVSIPKLFIFKNSKKIFDFSGAQNLTTFEKHLKTVMAQNF